MSLRITSMVRSVQADAVPGAEPDMRTTWSRCTSVSPRPHVYGDAQRHERPRGWRARKRHLIAAKHGLPERLARDEIVVLLAGEPVELGTPERSNEFG
jgi:hypothetical protein